MEDWELAFRAKSDRRRRKSGMRVIVRRTALAASLFTCVMLAIVAAQSLADKQLSSFLMPGR